MKKTALLLICNILFNLGFGQNKNEVLEKTISQLESLNTIAYEVTVHDVANDLGRNKIDKANCYFEFSGIDTLIEAKYQFKHTNGEQVFNGKEQFSVLDKEKVVLINNNPSKDQLQSSIFMNFSILELKKLLPKLRADTTIKIKTGNDTIINNKDSYQLEIQIPHRYIGRGSELIEAKNSDIDIFNYQLFVSKKNYLPIQFGMIYLENNGFKTTTFSNYKNLKREDSVWNYEKISDEYLRFTYEEYFSRMRANKSNSTGQKAPDWSLKNTENELVKLSQQKSKLTLIEFWFPHCKGCVLAVPELNEIQEKFSTQELSVYGIEFTNNKREYLINYIEEQNVKYPTLYMGKEVAERYGVYAAPTFYLIDKEGYIKKVIVGYEKGKLLSLINESL